MKVVFLLLAIAPARADESVPAPPARSHFAADSPFETHELEGPFDVLTRWCGEGKSCNCQSAAHLEASAGAAQRARLVRRNRSMGGARDSYVFVCGVDQSHMRKHDFRVRFTLQRDTLTFAADRDRAPAWLAGAHRLRFP